MRSSASAGNRGCSIMSAASSSARGKRSLSAVKPMVPASVPTLALIDVPRSCWALENSSAVVVAVPSLSICAVNEASPSLSGVSYDVAPPTNDMANATRGRSFFTLTTRSAPLARRTLVHVGMRVTGAGAGTGGVSRSSFAAWASIAADGTASERIAAIASARGRKVMVEVIYRLSTV